MNERKVLHTRVRGALKERLEATAERRMIGVSLIVERAVERELDRLDAEEMR